MKVSVIVPVYNVEEYLEKCLNSLVQQTLQDMEILVVDDGSKDRSSEIARRFEQAYPEKVKIFTKENGGLSSARNLAMEHARGEYLGFVDSDDWVDLNMYQEMYDTAIREGADIVVCDVDKHFPTHVVHYTAQPPEEWFKGAPAVWSKLYKRSMVGTDRFLPGRWYEDLEFTTKQFMKTDRIAVNHGVSYHYFSRESSIMQNNNSLKNLDIIAVLESVEAFAKESGYEEKYRSVLEYLYLDHILVAAVNRVQMQTAPEKKEVIRQLRQTVTGKYPMLCHDAVFRQLPHNRRIVAWLNAHGLVGISAFLLNTKRKLQKRN